MTLFIVGLLIGLVFGCLVGCLAACFNLGAGSHSMERYEDIYRREPEEYYWKYCHECKYEKLSIDDETCDFCMDRPINKTTGKPVNWIKREEQND